MSKSTFVKVIIIALSILIITNDLMMFPQINSLENLFNLGRYYYLNQDYNKSIATMEKLEKRINQYDQNENIKDIESRIRKLKGWAYLLMGASYEQQGDIVKARNQYKLAQPLLKKFEIDGLDLSSLLEYKKFISEEIREPIVVEKEFRELKKRKRMNPFLKVGIAAAAITTILIISNLKSKQPDSPAELEVSIDRLFIEPRTGYNWIIDFLFKNVGEISIGIEKITIPPPNSNINETVLFYLPGPLHNPIQIVAGGSVVHSESFFVEDYKGVEKITINIHYSDARSRTYFKQIEVKLEE